MSHADIVAVPTQFGCDTLKPATSRAGVKFLFEAEVMNPKVTISAKSLAVGHVKAKLWVSRPTLHVMGAQLTIGSSAELASVGVAFKHGLSPLFVFCSSRSGGRGSSSAPEEPPGGGLQPARTS